MNYQYIDSLNDKPALDAFLEQHPHTSAPNIYLRTADRPLYRIGVNAGLINRLQQEIGGGMVTLQQQQALRCYVLDINSALRTDGTANGVELAWQYLRRSGAELVRLDLAQLSSSQRIPTDGVAILPAPTNPWPPVARQALTDYLQAGGDLLVIADDRLPPDLHLTLRQRGIIMALPPGEDQPPEVVNQLDRSLRAGELRFDRLIVSPEFGLTEHPLNSSVIDSGRQLLWPRAVPT